jgi:hypothetical protein
MRYFHRTSVPVDDVLAAADRYFGERMSPAGREGRVYKYSSGIGEVSVAVRPEGGHYTHITLTTDKVGESEVDKFAKRFLSVVHQHAHAGHEVRGAY